MTSTRPRVATTVAAGETFPRPAERLLRAASNLFAAHGIRAVGIDHILRDAGVAKASLYSTYGSKDALVIAYLTDLDQADRNRWLDAAAGVADPVAKILTFFDLASSAARRRDYRGCLYANAATEFPGVDLEPVTAHREWMRSTLATLLADAAVNRPDSVAREIQLLYDGALVGSKIERSVSPIKHARRLAGQLIDRHRRSRRSRDHLAKH